MVRRLVRRGLLPPLAGPESARPGNRHEAREPRRRVASRRPVEPGRPSLVSAAAPSLLRLRRQIRPRREERGSGGRWPRVDRACRSRVASLSDHPRSEPGSRSPLQQAERSDTIPSVQRSILKEGVVAGLIGAAVVAVWFLLFDIWRGQPFLTPGLLGAAVFQGVTNPIGLRPTVGNVLGYTIVHGLAFIAFGVVAASLMAVSEREPTLFVAFVILFASFEVFFFGVVGALGQSMLGALVWWAILIGNLLASLAMLWYFFRAHRALPRTLIGSWGGVLREGVVAGLIGAAVVAVWFLAIDAIQGEPLRTPKLLGTALLRQSAPTAAVLSYTVVHGLAFIVVGVIGSVLIAGAEQQPLFVFALVIFFTAFEVLFFGAVVILAKWVLDELAGWTIFVGNLLAVAAMLGYFFTGHRTLARRLTEAWADDD